MRVSVITLTLALSGLTAASAPSYADTVITFDVSGMLTTGTLGGTIDIDVTNGTVSSADITAPGTGTGPFTNVISFAEQSASSEIQLSDSTADLLLFLPNTTLTDYSGGPICSLSAPCAPPFSLTTEIVLPTVPMDTVLFTASVGSLTATPLPAALPLFATGLGAMGLFGWCRKRKAQAVA